MVDISDDLWILASSILTSNICRQAWRSFVNVTGNDARRLYVYFVNQFQQVSEISSAGKSSGRDIEGVGSSVSTLFVDYSAQETEAFASSPLLRAVYAGNETDLKEILSQSADKINEKDSAVRRFTLCPA